MDSLSDEIEPSRESVPDRAQKPSEIWAKRSKSRSTSIDAMLALASELGIPYEDDRLGRSGRVSVNFVDAMDRRQRRLVSKLLDNGFAYWPGKGFWR